MFSCLSICSQELESGGQTTCEGCVGLIFFSLSIGGKTVLEGKRFGIHLGMHNIFLAEPLMSDTQS